MSAEVDKDVDGWAFKRSDCVVHSAVVEKSTGGSKSPRWGAQAGNIISANGSLVMGSKEDLNSVTIRHTPTGLEATVDKFHPHRNKELALVKLERMVNKVIEEEKARVAKYKASQV